MVSAVCPNCHIILVEANSASIADLGASVDEAVALGAKFISNSWQSSEYSGETQDDQYFNHPGVAITASAGDSGYGVGYPAASQYVTTAGGTTLTQDTGAARGWTETAWSGTGSGCSAYEAKPSWQTDTGCAKRTYSDVSAVADPNTGVAIYDTTGEGGWLEVGGTSVSSPIIASTYALAGTPTAGTYPSAYPYLNASGGLNDVTSGSDGTCTPAYLCTAGPGYDGPTGLGTPNGVSAFTPVSYGTLTGSVTDAATGKPVTDGTVTAGGRTATLTSSGGYSLDLAPGSYSVTATGFGHAAKTTTGVHISAGAATTQNFALTATPTVTLSGTVADGSGHGWPLPATITVPGTPLPAVTSSPYTGQYSITVPAQATYTLDVTPAYPGYTPAAETVTVRTGNTTKNVKARIDRKTCDAAGYDRPTHPGKCTLSPGGLVAGTVRDGNTNEPVNAATIASTASPAQSGTSGTSGFYDVFSTATGPTRFTATAGGYASATASADVTVNAVVQQNWTLQAGQLTMTPSSASVTEKLGATKTVKVTLGNTGTQPVHVTLGAQNGGFIPTSQAAGKMRTGVASSGSGWVKIANYPTLISNQSVAYDPQSGDVYSVGGNEYACGYCGFNRTSAGYVYSPSTGQWRPIAAAPIAVDNAYAAFVDGTLYLAGGTQGPQTGYAALSAVYAYRPGSNSWAQVASLPLPLFDAAAAVLNGQLYVIGGNTGGANSPTPVKTMYRYDPAANKWTRLANYPAGTVTNEACGGVDGEIACTGGITGGNYVADGSTGTYLYNPVTNTWSQGADLPEYAQAMVYGAANGELQVAGGFGDTNAARDVGLSSALQYNPATNAWSTLPKLRGKTAASAVGWAGGSCGFYQVGGVFLPPGGSFGKALASAEMLPGYTQCDGSGGLPWLSENQQTVTVAPGQTVAVDVQLDSAKVGQPGAYQAGLYASTDSPYRVQVTDLTMNVTAATGMQEISGTVTTSSGTPIDDATVAFTGSSAVKTDATGHYQGWYDGGSGPVQVGAAKDGYQPQAVTVGTVAGKPATANFALQPDPTSTLPYPQNTTSAAHTAPSPARQTHPGRARASRSAGRSVSQATAHADKLTHHDALPADVRTACGKPAKNHAACMALVRTNVKSHKGLFRADTAPSGYGPSDLQSAYDLPSASAGSGQTVAVVDAYDDPTAEADLQTYRAQYSLPVCDTANGCFEKVNQEGQQGSYPSGDSGWAEEESLDLDMVSAICPSCHILLVEANSNLNTDLGASVDEAVALGAKFVSNSYGGSESSTELQEDQYYNHPGVAVTASAGDSGYGVNYPSASQYVTAVGGTTLTKDPSTARGWTETVWGSSSGGEGTGSGCSGYEPKPPWQADTGCANRTTADVSADANPNTGVAVYDTDGDPGWEVFGGTSVASPIIASTFALAGTPAAGTYPSSYPYVNASGTLNDVTSGANGSCTPAYLCTAGTGYDGPTGLGTPDGVTAFAPVTYGTVSGTVTDTATGKPISGAAVTASDRSVTTGSSGGYTLELAPGTYSLTTAVYGYVAKTATGVQVTRGQTTSQDFALAAAPTVTLSGTVKDGSGHKWPLYAKVTVAGTPVSPVYTNPETGRYSLTIASQASYTLDVAPVYPGYTTATSTVQVGTGDATKNISVDADISDSCIAPGYAWPGSAGDTQFTGWTGSTPQDGWTDTANPGGNSDAWVFGNNPTSEPVNTAPPGSSGDYAIADSNRFGTGTMDTSLVSPVVNLTGATSPEIGFDTYYWGSASYPSTADVNLSLDGGQTWTTVWQQTTATVQGPVTIPIPQAAGQSDLQVRFHYTGTYAFWWSLDNVFIGSPACALVHGGLVTGVVKDANTGHGVNGTTVSEEGKHGGTGTSASTGDPAIPGGFYWLFSPSGSRNLTATDNTYAAATATVDVKPNAVTSQDWSLQAGHLTVTPGGASATVTLGGATTASLTYTNDGTVPLDVTLGEQDGGFTPTTGKSNAAQADTAQAGSGWANVAAYPTPIEDSAVAYDAQSGEVYSVGGATSATVGFFGSPLTATSAGYVYNPSTRRWTPIANVPQPLYSAGAAFVDGTLYVVGGWVGSTTGGISPADLSPAIYAYNPGANTWSQPTSLPTAVSNPGIAVLSGQLYVIGGCISYAEAPFCNANDFHTQAPAATMVDRYDPATNSWTRLASYPIPISGAACAGIDGEIVCAGGQRVNGWDTPSSATYLYNPASNTWTQGADIPYANFGMAYSGSGGELQIAGGATLSGTGWVTTKQASQYNPATNTWTALPPLAKAVAYSNGTCGMYIVGGSTSSYPGDRQSRPTQVLPGYDQCDGAGDTGWLSASPGEHGGFNLAPGASVTVTVRMNSKEVTQPGTYQAQLYATTNTPYPVQVTGVTMTVTPPAGWSLLSGKVTGASGNPVAGATVQVDTSASSVQSGQVDYTIITGADGKYQWWLDPSSDDPLQVIAAKDGYIQQVVTVKQPRASLRFALNPFPSVPY